MSVNIRQKKFNTAVNLAEQRNYFRAASVFATIDSYEAGLCYVACLAAMGEGAASANAFNKLYAEYGDEYNCVEDLRRFSPVTDKTVSFFMHKMLRKSKKVYGDSSKKSADNLLYCDFDFWSDDCDDLGLELDFYNDSALWDNPIYAEGNIFDTHDKVYRDHLRFVCEKAFLDSDDKKFKAYAKRIMALSDVDDIETVEAQVCLCYCLEKYAKASAYLKQLVLFGEQVSSRALRVGLACLFEKGAYSNRKLMKTLMEMSLPLLDEFSPTDLCDMIFYASRMVEDGDKLAYKFALKLFPLCDSSWMCSDLLRVCACAFYNGHDAVRARQAALKILEILPEDAFGKAMVQFVNKGVDIDYNGYMQLEPYDVREYYLPEPITTVQKYIVMSALNTPERTMADEQIQAIFALISACRVGQLKNPDETTTDFFTIVYAALQYGNFDKQAFVEQLLKPSLRLVDLPFFLVEPLVTKAIKMGCKDKLFVTADTYYWLDLSKITLSDERFVSVFATCASLVPVDPNAIEQAYVELTEKTGGIDESVTQMQLVYFLLCKTVKGFAHSPYGETFAKADKQALKEYL